MVIIKWINVVVFIALNFYLVMMFLTWVDDKIDGSDSFYDWTKKNIPWIDITVFFINKLNAKFFVYFCDILRAGYSFF